MRESKEYSRYVYHSCCCCCCFLLGSGKFYRYFMLFVFVQITIILKGVDAQPDNDYISYKSPSPNNDRMKRMEI